MIFIHYSLVKYQEETNNLIFEESFDFEDYTKQLTKKLLMFTYVLKNRLFIDYDLEIYYKHHIVVSQTNFKYNHRYYSHVRAKNKMIVYYPGRELTTDVLQNKTILKRVKRSVDEMFLKTIYAGLNHYQILKSDNIVHFLNFSPMFLYFYKNILKIAKFFFKLDECSLRFVYFNFKQPKKVFKKIRSIKKNLKKKNLIRIKQDDYTLINL